MPYIATVPRDISMPRELSCFAYRVSHYINIFLESQEFFFETKQRIVKKVCEIVTLILLTEKIIQVTREHNL